MDGMEEDHYMVMKNGQWVRLTRVRRDEDEGADNTLVVALGILALVFGVFAAVMDSINF